MTPLRKVSALLLIGVGSVNIGLWWAWNSQHWPFMGLFCVAIGVTLIVEEWLP